MVSNAKRGKWAEDIIAVAFGRLDMCDVKPTTPPVRVVSMTKGGKLTGYFESKGVCDFEGGYYGVHCSIEAKRHNGKENRWNFKQRVAEHQHNRMRTNEAHGGLSGVILAWDLVTGPIEWFGIPYHVIDDRLKVGKVSFSLDELRVMAKSSQFQVSALPFLPLQVGYFMESLLGASGRGWNV